jgi:hypothetical protein
LPRLCSKFAGTLKQVCRIIAASLPQVCSIFAAIFPRDCRMFAAQLGVFALSVCLICRLSIFFELPYKEDLKINHLLDPMHIFKNVATTVWEHLMGIRDSLAIDMDLQCYGKMPSAWPVKRKNGQVIIPRAP